MREERAVDQRRQLLRPYALILIQFLDSHHQRYSGRPGFKYIRTDHFKMSGFQKLLNRRERHNSTREGKAAKEEV